MLLDKVGISVNHHPRSSSCRRCPLLPSQNASLTRFAPPPNHPINTHAQSFLPASHSMPRWAIRSQVACQQVQEDLPAANPASFSDPGVSSASSPCRPLDRRSVERAQELRSHSRPLVGFSAPRSDPWLTQQGLMINVKTPTSLCTPIIKFLLSVESKYLQRYESSAPYPKVRKYFRIIRRY